MDAIAFIEKDIEKGRRFRKLKSLLLGASVVLLPIGLGIGLREDLNGIFDPRGLVPHLIAAFLLGLATILVQNRTPNARQFSFWIKVALTIALFLAMERIFWPWEERTHYLSANQFWQESARCFIKGSGTTIALGVWCVLFAFALGPLPSRAGRAFLAAVAGVGASVMLGFHCDSSSIAHNLIGHLAPGAIFAIGIFVFAERLFHRRLQETVASSIKNLNRIG